jgi:hypothetical protein
LVAAILKAPVTILFKNPGGVIYKVRDAEACAWAIEKAAKQHSVISSTDILRKSS